MVKQVTTAGVSHHYGRRQALSDVSFALPTGVTGLLGPNGAGKSTLMKLLATAMPLQSGVIQFDDLVFGKVPVSRLRRAIGYLPQSFEVMGFSSVERNVSYAGWAHGLQKDELADAVQKVLAEVDLADRAKSRARSLSGGMRQRLGLACALVHDPSVVILDEPTVGLDPVQRTNLRKLIAERGKNAIVLISTHMVEDLTDTAESVLVIGEGKLRFDGPVTQLEQMGEQSHSSYASPLEAGYAVALGLDR